MIIVSVEARSSTDSAEYCLTTEQAAEYQELCCSTRKKAALQFNFKYGFSH